MMRSAAFLKPLLLLGVWSWCTAASGQRFRAGAFAMDITPTNFPVIVNGGFLSKTADKVHSPLHVRWLVLDDGRRRVALGVMDTCLFPVEFADERLSSAQASRAMGSVGASVRQQRGSVDMVAATIFLQSYLDARRSGERIGETS